MVAQLCVVALVVLVGLVALVEVAVLVLLVECLVVVEAAAVWTAVLVDFLPLAQVCHLVTNQAGVQGKDSEVEEPGYHHTPQRQLGS